MNLILIQIDSLNRHFLPCYGSLWVQTPHLDAFSERAAIFDSHYVGSLPCMPARREIWAGVEEFWWRPWGPLEPWDRPIAYLAGQNGITTQLITDHYHFFDWGSHSYFCDYEGYEFIRGHEVDNYKTAPVSSVPDWARRMVEVFKGPALVYLQNVAGFQSEQDFFAPRVFQTAADWLESNRSQKQFFLHIDSFDVHEPFHIPEPYRSLYTDDDYTKYNPWPIYGPTDKGASALSEDEIQWVRAQFAGKLTMVDRWLGRLFDVLDRHRLWDNTAVIVTTDHGHYLGEHSQIGKPNCPCYDTLCRIPLMVWHPGAGTSGRRVDALTQTVDHYATALEILGVPVPQTEALHSRSYLPAALGATKHHRDTACYGYFGVEAAITDGEWTFIRCHDPQRASLFRHTVEVMTPGISRGIRRTPNRQLGDPAMTASGTVPGAGMPVWRICDDWRSAHINPFDDKLFHTASDPGQELNLAESRPPDQAARLAESMRSHMAAIGAPEEQFERLRLVSE